MKRATITIPSEDVNVTKANGSTVIDYPVASASSVTHGSYISEIATVLKYGAPSFAMRNGVLTNLLTGLPVPELPPAELAREYPNVNALLDDIAAKDYHRQVIVDGTLLPYTQYGTTPPAGFGSDPVSGKLVAMDWIPSPAVPVVSGIQVTSIGAPGASLSMPQVTESRYPDEGESMRIQIDGALANVPYVLRMTAPVASGLSTLWLTAYETPGQQVVMRTLEVAVNGKVVVPAGDRRTSQSVNLPLAAGDVIEATMVPEADGGFRWQARNN